MLALILAVAFTVKPPFYTYDDALKIAAKDLRPRIVVVSMDNCLSCDLLEQELRKLHKARQIDRVVLSKVNVTQQPEMRHRFKDVEAFPTTFIYDENQKLVHKFKGLKRGSELVQIIRQHVGEVNR